MFVPPFTRTIGKLLILVVDEKTFPSLSTVKRRRADSDAGLKG